MAALHQPNRLIWLTSALIEKKGRIATLLSRLVGLDCPGNAQPGLSAKFLNLLQQIDAERDKELELISEIQTVEDKHRERRLRHQLERADSAYQPDDTGKDCKYRKGLRWFFNPWRDHERNSLDNDKQDLRLD